MNIKQALDTMHSIIPYRYNVPPEQVQQAKNTIINAAKDGMLIPLDDFLKYCEKSADVSKELKDKCYAEIQSGKDVLTAYAYFEKVEYLYRYEIPQFVKGYQQNEILNQEDKQEG